MNKRSQDQEHFVVRDGRVFKVTKLPEQKPPSGRSRKSKFKFKDVGRPGDKLSD